ncbi:sigma-70 family RNA polymerase sigma factor [Paenibacillus sp. 2TAB26]|uniref:sigma-70 family RNA polymerase sigma factor n=1 Tax=Paenibacillus sp. 2TAB26 TaxID=3233005 RepID=UPI003F9D3F56
MIEKLSSHSILDDMDCLSYKLKQVVVLHYLNDLTQEEVAEIVRIPVGTVKSRLHYALKQLRDKRRRDIHV